MATVHKNFNDLTTAWNHFLDLFGTVGRTIYSGIHNYGAGISGLFR